MVNASSELIFSCGGDTELMISCYTGDLETTFFSYIEDEAEDWDWGTGGTFSLKNPKSMNILFKEKWQRNSEVQIIIQAYNQHDQLYNPPKLDFNFSIEGVEIKESKLDDLNQIISLVEISKDAELGFKTIDIIITDERTLNRIINFEIVEKVEVEDKDQREILIYWICLILLIIFIIILGILIEKRRKKKRK